VGVGREGSAEAEPVRPRLLLGDAPGDLLALQPVDGFNERRPLDACLDLDDAAVGVEIEDTLESAGVDVEGPCPELLPTHGVPSPGNGDGESFPSGSPHGIGELRGSRGQKHLRDPGGVEFGVDVVENDGLASVAAPTPRGKCCGYCASEETATGEHLVRPSHQRSWRDAGNAWRCKACDRGCRGRT
jgi:hypothetical protein